MSLLSRIGWLTLCAIVTACGPAAPAPSREAATPSPRAHDAPYFVEITEQAGLGLTAEPWPAGTGLAPEIMGPGVALVDLDGDMDLDIIQLRQPRPGRHGGAGNRLFLLEADGRYRDATAGSGLADPGFAQGVVVGDVNGDGAPDVFFANYGPDALYLNRGDATFERAVAAEGWDEDVWSSSAAFCDYDADGDLDLYVTRYLRYDPDVACLTPTGAVGYCDPNVFDGLPDRLYRNDGTGRFTDVSTEAGLVLPQDGVRAKGLGVVCVDLTGDGRLDFYVANDGEANQLWVQRGDGTFADEAAQRGVAVNRHGKPEASMGIAVGDVTGNGRIDLLLTHLEGENNTLYGGSPGALYRDLTPRSGMAVHDLGLTGFGCALLDIDLDGDLDLVVVNGKVRRGSKPQGASTAGFWSHYAEPNQIYENDGSGVFTNVSARERPFSGWYGVSRGLAFGDIDADGDVDLVVSNADNSLRLYRNDAPRRGRHWLSVRPLSDSGPAYGATVVVVAAGRRLLGVVPAGVSYMSHSGSSVPFGLGAVETIDRIEVRWPDGTTEWFPGGGADREVVVRRGRGEPA